MAQSRVAAAREERESGVKALESMASFLRERLSSIRPPAEMYVSGLLRDFYRQFDAIREGDGDLNEFYDAARLLIVATEARFDKYAIDQDQNSTSILRTVLKRIETIISEERAGCRARMSPVEVMANVHEQFLAEGKAFGTHKEEHRAALSRLGIKDEKGGWSYTQFRRAIGRRR
jgi:hypothetical protein